MSAGADVNAIDSFGEAPLVWASKVEEAEYLLAGGAELDHQDEHGWTALHKAIQRGRSELAAFYLSQGADVHLQDSGGATPLALACQGDDVALIESMLRIGAKPDATALIIAASHGQTESAALLIEAGADVNWRDGSGPHHFTSRPWMAISISFSSSSTTERTREFAMETA